MVKTMSNNVSSSSADQAKKQNKKQASQPGSLAITRERAPGRCKTLRGYTRGDAWRFSHAGIAARLSNCRKTRERPSVTERTLFMLGLAKGRFS